MSHPILLDGKMVSQHVLATCASRVKRIVEATGTTPCLATVLVGDDPASVTYVKMKGKRCETVGMKSLQVQVPATTTTSELLAKLTELGRDRAVSGILLQHPVPRHIDERAAFNAIPAVKATGFTHSSPDTVKEPMCRANGSGRVRSWWMPGPMTIATLVDQTSIAAAWMLGVAIEGP